MNWATYEHTDGYIIHRYPIETGSTVAFRAKDIRKERKTVYAHIEIVLNEIVIAYTDDNVGRDETRTRLANSAHQHLSPLEASAWDKSTHKIAFDLFCNGLWQEMLGSAEGDFVTPTVEDDEPQPYILYPYIAEESGTILFAPPGRGKSWVTTIVAVSVDAGISDVFHVPAQRRVLFINLERSERSVRRRIRQVNRALGLEADRPLLMMNRRGRSLADVADAAIATIRRHDVGLVVLDSISRAGMGKLIADDTANAVVDTLNGWGIAYFAIGHSSPRGDERNEGHIFGSMHFDAGADMLVQLLTQELPGILGVGIQVTKANETSKARIGIRVLGLHFNDDGIMFAIDPRPQPGAFAEIDAGRAASKVDLLRELATDQGFVTAKSAATELGGDRSGWSRLLSGSDMFAKLPRNPREPHAEQRYGLVDSRYSSDYGV